MHLYFARDGMVPDFSPTPATSRVQMELAPIELSLPASLGDILTLRLRLRL
jgi:hypothetical protein